MKANWSRSFAQMLKSEGGYVNDPHDRGGETNLGVTRAAWSEYLGRPVRDGEMRALTAATVEPFYRSRYWNRCRCDELPSGVDYAVFDFAVNAGPGRSIKTLQRAAGVADDGVIGQVTMNAVAKVDAMTLIERFSAAKTAFYQSLVARDASQHKFIKGWLARVDAVENAASSMIA